MKPKNNKRNEPAVIDVKPILDIIDVKPILDITEAYIPMLRKCGCPACQDMLDIFTFFAPSNSLRDLN